jgi:GAF domain
MLLKLSNRISECLAIAEDARERANDVTDPSLKAHLLDLEAHWLRVVESYRFVEQASRFLDDSHRLRSLPEKLPQTGVLVIACPVTGKDFSTGILTDEASLTLTPQEFTRSHCPHCDAEHSWWTKDARLVPALPQSKWVEFTCAEAAKTGSQGDQKRPAFNGASLADALSVLVHTAIENTDGAARAAFYIAKGAELYHVTGMPEAYARQVNGFVIGAQSLACGLAAAQGQPIITRDVIEEPLWKPWLWLAEKFDYRACWSFPVGTSAGKIVGTFAMYYKEPREATPRELDLATTITRAAAPIMISPPQPSVP